MTIFPHAIAGAAVATTTSNPSVAFLLGFISHFVLDILPHLEPNNLKTVRPDGTSKWSIWLYLFVATEFILTGLLFWFWLRQRADFPILIYGAVGGIFPDLIVVNPFLQKLKNIPFFKQLFSFHDKIHLDLPIRFWYVSLIVESALIAFLIIFLTIV